MIRQSFFTPAFIRSRQYAAACRDVANVPFRCTLITESQSSSVIENNIRSRRIPALLTTTSRPPNVSIACFTAASPPAHVLMSSVLAAAAPPAEVISLTTSWAGPVSPPEPSRLPPTSLTTTLAPWRASISAYSRPSPRPAPVTMQIRSTQSFSVISVTLPIDVQHRHIRTPRRVPAPDPRSSAHCRDAGGEESIRGAESAIELRSLEVPARARRVRRRLVDAPRLHPQHGRTIDAQHRPGEPP